jgi:hypothetical protein
MRPSLIGRLADEYLMTLLWARETIWHVLDEESVALGEPDLDISDFSLCIPRKRTKSITSIDIKGLRDLRITERLG